MRKLLKYLLQARFRISTQLYLGISIAVAFTIGASLVAWLFFNRVSDVHKLVTEDSVPEMAAAFAVARQSAALVDAAPHLTAAMTMEAFTRVSSDIAEKRSFFEARLNDLLLLELEPILQDERDEHLKHIRASGEAIISNIQMIEESVATRFELAERSETLKAELLEVQSKLTDILVPAIDNQLFYTMTGYHQLGETPVPLEIHFSKKEFDRYRHLATLYADMTSITQLVASAFNLSDTALLEPLRERFEATMASIERSLSALGTAPVRQQITPAFTQLFKLGLGTDGSFDIHTRKLTLTQLQQALLMQNDSLAIELVAEVDNLVSAARLSAEKASRTLEQTIRTGQNLLIFINTAGIAGAVLIAWLFVGRVLLRRLDSLSRRMRHMAEGDLETELNIGGRDEVAEMAAALEVFRRNALEVQRLNLVEKLAKDLRDKNSQLETALADLRRMQDQIVVREKLASLGELTAGVAHEIKNPLNFVKNFAEASEELLEELEETLQQGGEKLSKEQRELTADICCDLNENLERIRNHGNRADRIVRDMLMMGRGSSDRQPTDINGLLEEHAWLAFHSARATDSDFQLEIKQDLSPEVGEIEVIPQDMGRVFLNMVSNACHATDERRKALEKEGSPYEPTMWISTKRTQEHVEVRIRDNGAGIPPDIIDKIFNPFFTTKPTDQGTGLGLALSNDIVREHGGTIRVESELEKFTEMIVTIPTTISDIVKHESNKEIEEPTTTS